MRTHRKQMVAGQKIDRQRPPVRLYLMITAAVPARPQADLLAALLAEFDAAAVLVRLASAAEREMIDAVKQLAPAVQAAGAALIVAEYVDIVARAGADGAHLTGIDALRTALPGLKPDRIASAGGLRSRHDAMLAGEAGTDYVMFGEPGPDARRPPLDMVIDRVAWWSELFVIPCVAYAASLDEIGPLCAAGADFVALGDAVFADPRGGAAALREASERLQQAEALA
jgi:thiamine-phosphate pyrophosphorylase